MLFYRLSACRTRTTAGKIKHTNWLRNDFVIKILACLKQILACNWCLAFAVMVNITKMFLQSLITDIALTLIFCLLYPLQATIQISRALAWHTAKGVNKFQMYQLAACRLLIKYCCTAGSMAKNTDLQLSWPLDKLSISMGLLCLFPFSLWDPTTPGMYHRHCSWL